MRLAGARALVTGASSGIGAAVAVALIGRRASVAVNGREVAALARVPGAVAVPGDLTGTGVPARVVDEAVAALGGLDVLVSVAGIGWAGPMADMPAEEIDALVDVNLRAPLHLVRAALPHLRARPGAIALVGSIAGLVGIPRESTYSATKAGLCGLADALRAELAPRRVGVTLVAPAAVDTAFFARRNRPYDRRWPRPVSAERIAEAALCGIETGRAEVVVPSWMAVPVALHRGTPGLYRYLAGRFG